MAFKQALTNPILPKVIQEERYLSLWVNGTVSRFKFGDPDGQEKKLGKKTEDA